MGPRGTRDPPTRDLERHLGEGGFTLIELLVVMVINGLLAGIAIPLFPSQKDKARESVLKNDLRNAATFAERFAVDHHGQYGDGLAGAQTFDISSAASTAAGLTKSNSTTTITSVTAKTKAGRLCVESTTNPNPVKTWSYDNTRAVQLASGNSA